MPELTEEEITQADWLEYEQWANAVERKRELEQGVNGISKDDLINSPDHYTAGGLEAIEVIKAKLTPEEYRGYLKGSNLKYMLRANFKGQHDDDISKAMWFLDELYWEIDEDAKKKA